MKSICPLAMILFLGCAAIAPAALADDGADPARAAELKEKAALIAQLAPVALQPGDPARGNEAFVQNCAVCHKFNGEGRDVGPDLTLTGAYGAARLLKHIVDPNLEIAGGFSTYTIETLDGESHDGVMVRETAKAVRLRNVAGDADIPIADIKSRRDTGRSLMPVGFEVLGGEKLRDILSFICAGESNYFALDLRSAFTADSRQGLWTNETNAEETLRFKRFGLVKEGVVPFEIVHPLKFPSGKNLIVLKGGTGLAKTRPQKVEVPNIGVKAAKLHFLGGIGGGAYPADGGARKDLPVAKVTVHYADQQSEEIILKNGQEFADWSTAADVPGSQSAAELVAHGQVRWFTKTLNHPAVIESMTLESFDNEIAPVFVAITAELN